MTGRVLLMMLVFFAQMTCVRAQSTVDSHAIVQQLCNKWDGTIFISRPSGPVFLRCAHIRTEFNRMVNGEPAFKEVRELVKSVKNQSLLHIKASDFPADQECTVRKGQTVSMTCKTVGFEPEVSTHFLGTKAGQVVGAIVTADANYFRKEMSREIKSQHGVLPTTAFLNFYLELLVVASSFVGGPDEQYSLSKDKIIVTFKFR